MIIYYNISYTRRYIKIYNSNNIKYCSLKFKGLYLGLEASLEFMNPLQHKFKYFCTKNKLINFTARNQSRRFHGSKILNWIRPVSTQFQLWTVNRRAGSSSKWASLAVLLLNYISFFFLFYFLSLVSLLLKVHKG